MVLVLVLVLFWFWLDRHFASGTPLYTGPLNSKFKPFLFSTIWYLLTQRRNNTLTMAAELPMNITISMGDVSFSLTPTSDDQFSLSSSDFRSPSPQKSQRRSSSRQDANHRASPPILSIRQGTSTSPSTPHRSIRRSSFASKVHVREMKENIE